MDPENIFLRLAGIEEDSIVDGPGLRLAVFTQGCLKNCPGCHNPETHNLDGGNLFSLSRILEIYKRNPILSGITFSGGEPFLQAAPLAILAREVHSLKGNVITYTGNVFEDLAQNNDPAIRDLLEESDILIDGPFIQELKNLELSFRGSENQRILDRAARLQILRDMERGRCAG